MIFGNEKLVEAIVGFYYWVIVLENFEFFVFDFNIWNSLRAIEESFGFIDKCGEWMLRILIKFSFS